MRSSMPPFGMTVASSARGARRRRSSRYSVMSSDPAVNGRPGEGAQPGGEPVGEHGAAGGDAQQDDLAGIGGLAGPLQDLVGDAIHDPGDVRRGQEFPNG